VIIGRMM